MSALLGTLEASQGASTLGGALGNYAMNSIGGDLKQDASGVGGQNPLAQLLAPTPQPQAPAYPFPQMPNVPQEPWGIDPYHPAGKPISQYFVGGKSG